MSDPKPPADTSWVKTTDGIDAQRARMGVPVVDIRPDPNLAAREPEPKPFRELTAGQKLVFVVAAVFGLALTAVALGMLLLVIGLIWRMIRVVWGMG